MLIAVPLRAELTTRTGTAAAAASSRHAMAHAVGDLLAATLDAFVVMLHAGTLA